MSTTSLFLDSNVWLSFYYYSADDLEQLHKLNVLIKGKRVKLFVCEQVVNEVHRNREAKITSAIKRFKGEKLDADIPRMCQDYPEHKALQEALRTFQQEKARLLERLGNDASSRNLGADKIIAELFDAGERIATSPAIVEAARLRVDLGNPPGKERSLGDAINWESLLATVPDEEELVFITNDGDYLSKLGDNDFSPFLEDEWREKKNAAIVFFPRLSSFFSANFPDIKFAADLERALLVSDLQESSSFASTRRALQRLAPIADELTAAQVEAVVDAALSNNQIYWIAGDADIKRFLQRVISHREQEIADEKLVRFYQLLA